MQKILAFGYKIGYKTRFFPSISGYKTRFSWVQNSFFPLHSTAVGGRFSLMRARDKHLQALPCKQAPHAHAHALGLVSKDCKAGWWSGFGWFLEPTWSVKGKRHGREAEKRGGNATSGGDSSRAWRGPYPKGVCRKLINELRNRCTTYRIAIRLQVLENQQYTGAGVERVRGTPSAGGCKGGGAPPAGGSGASP